jgi:hypothetical protein
MDLKETPLKKSAWRDRFSSPREIGKISENTTHSNFGKIILKPRKKKKEDPVVLLRKTMSNLESVNSNKFKRFGEQGIRAFIKDPIPLELRNLASPPSRLEKMSKDARLKELQRRKCDIYELKMVLS